MTFPITFRVRLFTLCLVIAHTAQGVPIPTALNSLVVLGSTATSSLSTKKTASTPSSTSPPLPPASNLTDYITITETETDTVTATVSLSPSTKPRSPPPTPTLASPMPTSWSAPSAYDDGDLSGALAVEKWAWGKDNVAVATGIPSSAWAAASTSTARSAKSKSVSFPRVDLTNSTIMQVVFPAGSVNPGNKSSTTGGVGLYSTPLNLSAAMNVTFTFSVFFPVDFDFVKGGKLPGLYGGHPGCSGGAESEDCFSTRTMWRKDGMGELYLYAPRDVQPEEPCQAPPVSYCDTSYGMSIGRGSWTFERGAWTAVQQTLTLNTPGVADGAIEIRVNDKLVIASNAVLFRKSVVSSTTSKPTPVTKPTSKPSRPSPTSIRTAPRSTPTPKSAPGGLLEGLLGGLGLGNLLLVDTPASNVSLSASPTLSKTTFNPILSQVATSTSTITSEIPIFTPPVLHLPPVIPTVANRDVFASAAKPLPMPIAGVMLHTFFGGSSQDWATPRDQMLYFDRFSLVVNA